MRTSGIPRVGSTSVNYCVGCVASPDLATNTLLSDSEFMKKDDKRYFLDLKENSRGRFLRVSQVVRYTRQHVAFPAILLIELRNAINEVSCNLLIGST